ncbi:MAG TPA: metal-dependent transcriptional regulator [Methanocella sp.]|uniref:metal-dependent transcriptional regulator n=1 Tax=Methanocella sp. TaxID=2052833 RepID=UPI002BCCE84D|nr:metal-dependent transcriptional regulator [Methanocella sp.]HTY89768.1 metal-dependent transcriptional regulator [Methanocella sp.]
MKDIDGFELSPKKSQYLMFILEHNGKAFTTNLAEHFRLDPSTVTKTVTEMSSTGLIEHERYGSICLTDRGREYAEFLIRRHRIVELMLSHYGLTAEEACVEATRLEGHISKDLVDKICTSLGHPTMGICGPIKHDTCCCCPGED